jgi:hypothetical protein
MNDLITHMKKFFFEKEMNFKEVSILNYVSFLG